MIPILFLTYSLLGFFEFHDATPFIPYRSTLPILSTGPYPIPLFQTIPLDDNFIFFPSYLALSVCGVTVEVTPSTCVSVGFESTELFYSANVPLDSPTTTETNRTSRFRFCITQPSRLLPSLIRNVSLFFTQDDVSCRGNMVGPWTIQWNLEWTESRFSRTTGTYYVASTTEMTFLGKYSIAGKMWLDVGPADLASPEEQQELFSSSSVYANTPMYLNGTWICVRRGVDGVWRKACEQGSNDVVSNLYWSNGFTPKEDCVRLDGTGKWVTGVCDEEVRFFALKAWPGPKYVNTTYYGVITAALATEEMSPTPPTTPPQKGDEDAEETATTKPVGVKIYNKTYAKYYIRNVSTGSGVYVMNNETMVLPYFFNTLPAYGAIVYVADEKWRPCVSVYVKKIVRDETALEHPSITILGNDTWSLEVLRDWKKPQTSRDLILTIQQIQVVLLSDKVGLCGGEPSSTEYIRLLWEMRRVGGVWNPIEKGFYTNLKVLKQHLNDVVPVLPDRCEGNWRTYDYPATILSQATNDFLVKNNMTGRMCDLRDDSTTTKSRWNCGPDGGRVPMGYTNWDRSSSEPKHLKGCVMLNADGSWTTSSTCTDLQSICRTQPYIDLPYGGEILLSWDRNTKDSTKPRPTSNANGTSSSTSKSSSSSSSMNHKRGADAMNIVTSITSTTAACTSSMSTVISPAIEGEGT
eukprot:PhF_6_TR44242/c0_g2_i4/m.68040